MYIPSSFRESDISVQHDFIEQNSFGLLISQLSGSLFATHLPLVLLRDEGDCGTLVGHMARANPQWKQLADQECLAVFSGPHCYISPSMYEADNMVPTWNYVAVHAYGKVELVEDRQKLRSILQCSVNFYESSSPTPWSIERDTDDTSLERMLAQIVGFRIKIERLEGKWKVNQNHPEDRRQKVADALESQGDEDSLAIAKLVRESLRTNSQ